MIAGNDLAVTHFGNPVAALGQGAVMGDQQQGSAFLLFQFEEQLDNLLAGFLIEISGGFIGKQDAGA